jgi:hypothetical protein
MALMDLDEFLKEARRALVKPPYRKKAKRTTLPPYDSHRQRERYGRQEARRQQKLAMLLQERDKT